MARIDAGDSFDHMLQAWLLNGQSVRQNQQYQDHPADLPNVPSASTQLRQTLSASIDRQPASYKGGLEFSPATALKTVDTAQNCPPFGQVVSS